jgi:6-methylsalicylate decarboxylase
MTTFDLHQHLWPAGFVEALRERTAPPRLDGTTLVLREGSFEANLSDHDVSHRLASLDEDGIDVAVLSLQTTLGLDELADEERISLEDAWIDGIREIVADAGGRLDALAPRRVVDGFAGVALDAGLLLDLDAAAPVLDAVQQVGRLVLVHPGPVARRDDTPQWWAGIVSYTAQMQAAWFAWLDAGRTRWPDVRIVFAILAGGAPFHLERLALRGIDVRSTLDPNVYLDVATYGRRSIELCIETFGVAQLVYGSDTPVVDSTPTLQAVRGFGDSVAQIILSDNPTRLLP